ncbi:MAG: hypothetical protein RBR43_07240 [Desulfuromonadaceae bacterium]|nr:hypothetical protein [Desulfuromonas sp.]MDY0185652.1 hypothetical protein [Desulfuromonadaceae bacterium]
MCRLILPRGIAVKQFDDSKRVKIPQIFERFTPNRFSGYMQFDFDIDAGIVCFQDGHIVAVMFEHGTTRVCGREALLELFRELQRAAGVIKIYRLESELVPYLVQMCHGLIEARGQLVRFLDAERLLTYLEHEQFDGCIRIYTKTEAALLFYGGGRAAGFFPDGASSLHDNLEVEHSLAREPECRYDLIRTAATDQDAAASLNTMYDINLEKEWLSVWHEFNV